MFFLNSASHCKTCNISTNKIHVCKRKSGLPHLPHRKDGEMKLLNRKVNVKRGRQVLVRARYRCRAAAAGPPRPPRRDPLTAGAPAQGAHAPGSRPLRTAAPHLTTPPKPARRAGAFSHRATSARVAKPRGASPGASQRQGRERWGDGGGRAGGGAGARPAAPAAGPGKAEAAAELQAAAAREGARRERSERFFPGGPRGAGE